MSSATPTPTQSRESSDGRAGKIGSYRRNGKLQSCEPCRRGKLRCDHTVPSCARCVKRGRPELCIYHPAPLTKPRHSAAIVPATTANATIPIASRGQTARGALEHVVQKGIISPPESTQPSVQHSRSSKATPHRDTPAVSDHSSPQETRYTRRTISAKQKIGFLGTSSYSAVFTQNVPNLEVDDAENLDPSCSPPPLHLPMEVIRAGAGILSLLNELHKYEQFMSRWLEVSDSMTIPSPIYGIWIREIWSEFGDLLSNYKTTNELHRISELVWRNTLDSMPFDAHTTGRKWTLLSAGKKLRWETVGLIFSKVGLVSSTLSDYDTIFTILKEKPDRPTLTRKMLDAVEDCIGFARQCESTTTLFACLLYESSILLENVRGDTYYGAWTRLGETCDLMVLMGLHQEKKVNSSTSFFVCQLRTRIFQEVYGRDKSMATFLGRPPRLSYRYCVLQLPLDLSDDQLMLEGPELEEVLSTLEDGWNTSGHLHRATWRRVWALNARIREDILEIALGTNDTLITERANQIFSEIEGLKANIPVIFMRIDPTELLDAIRPSGRMKHGTLDWTGKEMPVRVFIVIWMSCGIRQTEFLLKRALVNRGHAHCTELILPARGTLSLLLKTLAKRELFRDFQIDLIGLIAFHGLPSAGVLAIELLKQEQSKQYTPEILPRSEIIQDISVFLGALATVGPGEGNHAICAQGHRALKRLLDKILSPDPVPQRADGTLDTPLDFGGSMIDMSGLYFPTGNDAEFLQWLGDVDWDRGSWLNPV